MDGLFNPRNLRRKTVHGSFFHSHNPDVGSTFGKNSDLPTLKKKTDFPIDSTR